MAKISKVRKEQLRIRFDYNNMMSDFIGEEQGFTLRDIAANKKLVDKAFKTVSANRGTGMMGWTELPYNQAEVVEDGTQLTIASSKDNKKKEKSQKKGTDANSGKVNLNQATKEELMTLTGIGEAKAVAIIAYREANGRFQKIEDLMNITGIKEGVFDKIQSQICV